MVCIVKMEDVDQKVTDQGSSSKYISSHFEAYTCPIHEQVTVQKTWWMEEDWRKSNSLQMTTDVTSIKSTQNM